MTLPPQPSPHPAKPRRSVRFWIAAIAGGGFLAVLCLCVGLTALGSRLPPTPTAVAQAAAVATNLPTNSPAPPTNTSAPTSEPTATIEPATPTAEPTSEPTTPPTPTEPPPPTVEPDQSAEASVICERFVKQRLKSPSTASFASVLWDGVKAVKSGDKQYTFRSWVDSQNSFGAMIRTNFICVVEDRGDTWHLVSLDTK